jgi:hypothetical protein
MKQFAVSYMPVALDHSVVLSVSSPPALAALWPLVATSTVKAGTMMHGGIKVGSLTAL